MNEYSSVDDTQKLYGVRSSQLHTVEQGMLNAKLRRLG